MNLLRPRRGGGQAGDRQRRGVGGEEAAGGQHRLGLLRDLRLQRALLEHGFDDEVAAAQLFGARGRRDQRQHGGLLVGRHGAARHALVGELLRCSSCPARRVSGDTSLSTLGTPRIAFDVRDAGAHHPGAEDADLARLPLRHGLRPRGARLDRDCGRRTRAIRFLRHRARPPVWPANAIRCAARCRNRPARLRPCTTGSPPAPGTGRASSGAASQGPMASACATFGLLGVPPGIL